MNNIKLLRTQKKITQDKLSKLLGVSRSSISMWENEINEPDNATLIKMAQIFDTSIGYILGVEEGTFTDMDFCERLKVLRINKGLTQEALAKILGVERSSIGKYESSGVIPSIDVLKKMSNYFGVSVDYLMTGKEPEGKPEITEQDIKVALFNGDKEVTDEMWEEVKNFAEMVALKYRYKKNDDNNS